MPSLKAAAAAAAAAMLTWAGLAFAATPARADIEPYCPDGCVGASVGDTNCRSDDVFLTAITLDDPATQTPVAELHYSRMCQTYWGQYQSYYDGVARWVQLYNHPQYGGINTRIYDASAFNAGYYETTMVSSVSGSVKFCLSGDTTDPDTYDAAPNYDCTVWM
ncbi:hypothetical protein [Actinoplanes sp. NPDC051851]|uniref:hypothetical protein n=1 Tax=Actinoplanes sp. NPDC051851 TaxID=3154753 RepID=UPI00342DCAF5